MMGNENAHDHHRRREKDLRSSSHPPLASLVLPPARRLPPYSLFHLHRPLLLSKTRRRTARDAQNPEQAIGGERDSYQPRASSSSQACPDPETRGSYTKSNPALARSVTTEVGIHRRTPSDERRSLERRAAKTQRPPRRGNSEGGTRTPLVLGRKGGDRGRSCGGSWLSSLPGEKGRKKERIWR
jgi:hypothetical protein